jgi:hypothetical protein
MASGFLLASNLQNKIFTFFENVRKIFLGLKIFKFFEKLENGGNDCITAKWKSNHGKLGEECV